MEYLYRVTAFTQKIPLSAAYAMQPKRIEFDMISTTETHNVDFDTLLRQVLILFSILIEVEKYSYREWMSNGLGTREFLSDTLPEFQPSGNSQGRCLAWMWLIVANSWRYEDRRLTERGSKLLRAFKLRYPTLTCAPLMRWLCQEFFWEVEFEDGFQEIWNQKDRG